VAESEDAVIKTAKLEKKIKRFAKRRGLVYSIARNSDNTVEIRIEPNEAIPVKGFSQ
jgi:hypothetical protein